MNHHLALIQQILIGIIIYLVIGEIITAIRLRRKDRE